MPYEGEFASYGPLRRLAENVRVRDLLRRSLINTASTAPDGQATVPEVEASKLEPSIWVPDWVLAVDGSHLEVPVETGFPGAEASYVTVASVLLDVARMMELDAARPVDPREFRSTQRAESIDAALPGCNVVLEGHHSAPDSLRRAMFEVFADVRMSADGESLLDTYEALLAHKPEDKQQRCPYEDCPALATPFVRSSGEYACMCSRKNPLYSTDALRIHEGMQPAGTNGAMFAEIMQVWERVWVVHILRTLERKGWLSSLQRLAIVLDGPLAVFGHPAWLSHAIQAELSRINGVAKQFTDGLDMLMIGVEKSGAFVDHFASLDQDAQGRTDVLPGGRALLLTDRYIKENIIFSKSDKLYGRDTYFGRKLLYKTSSGSRIVAMLPFLAEEHRDTTIAEPRLFPRLADALNLLEQLVSSRFPNALSPLVSAHKEAAIPLHLGNRVLEDLARQLISEKPKR